MIIVILKKRIKRVNKLLMEKESSSNELYKDLVEEIRREQSIPPAIKDDTLISYIKEGIYDITDVCGTNEINFSKDLVARSLLKNYVLYANYKRLAEFKELYSSEYVRLQRDYYVNPNVQ